MNKRQSAVLWSTCVVVVAICVYSIWEEGDFADGMQRTPPYLIAPVIVAVILYFLLGQNAPKVSQNKEAAPKSESAIQREAAEPERIRLAVQLLANKIYDAHPPKRPPAAPDLVVKHGQGGEEPWDAYTDRGFYWFVNQARLEAFLVAYSITFSRPGRASAQPPGDPIFYKFRALAAETLRPLSRAVDESLRANAEAMGASFPETQEEARVEELLSKSDQRRIAFNQNPSVRQLAEPYAKLFGLNRQAATEAVAAVLAAHIEEGAQTAMRLQALINPTAR